MAQITHRPIDKTEVELVSLEATDPKKKTRDFKIDKLETSKNIQAFDAKAKRARESAQNYNAVSLKPKTVIHNKTAFELISNPTYNTIGKFLGVDTVHEWGKDYDKVEKIVDWAITKVGTDDLGRLIDFLNGAANFAPTFGTNHRKLDQVYLMSKLQSG